jgi:Zn-dependent peptidase ImmA (M78 family)
MQRVFVVIDALQSLLAEKPEVRANSFPRDLERLIIYGLEIPVVTMPDLTLDEAAKYLCILRGKLIQVNEVLDRKLYGLLHVGPPCNIIFIREGLQPHVRNYVLAHELGHFLIDVFLIRRLWLKTLPEQKIAIERAFMWQEYDAWLDLHALIKGLPPRPGAITARGKQIAPETSEREVQADLFARELMAPWDVVSPLFELNGETDFIRLLHAQFGLPKRVASYYYSDLRRYLKPHPDVIERLFAPLLISPEKNSL